MFSSHIFVFYSTLALMLSGSNYAASLHRFHSGDCPKIEKMSEFYIDRFLGQWYVLKNANDNGNVCLREEFNASQEVLQPKHDEMIDMARNEVENSEPKIEDDSTKRMEKVYYVKRSYLPFGERQFIYETGKIKFLSNNSQSEMEINFPYAETGMLNLKHYEVIATDYDKFALIWRCQKTIFGHRRSAQLMSRYPKLEKKTMEELTSLLRHFEAQHDVKFLPVRQSECTEVSSNQESITSKPVADPSTIIIVDKNAEEEQKTNKNKKKLINIDVGGFHLSISYPFW